MSLVIIRHNDCEAFGSMLGSRHIVSACGRWFYSEMATTVSVLQRGGLLGDHEHGVEAAQRPRQELAARVQGADAA